MASNPPLADVMTYLSTAGLGLTLGTNLFGSYLPDQPDQCVAIFEYPGSPSDFTMGSGVLPVVEETRFQVMARDVEVNYAVNELLIQSIYRSILTVINVTLSGTWYQRWEAIQAPFFLHRDEKVRVHHVLNFMSCRQPV